MAEYNSPQFGDSVEDLTEFKDEKGVAQRWCREIKLAEKEQEKWQKQVARIIRRYKDKGDYDEDPLFDTGPSFKDSVRYNILWSNVAVLQPATYARTPKVKARRRFRDADPVARVACKVIQRATSFEMESQNYDSVMKMCRDDMLFGGRGVAWVSYDKEEVDGKLKKECAKLEYIHWQDFLHSPARHWSEVRWVARKAYLSKEQLKERFPKVKVDTVPLDYKPDSVEREMDQSKYDFFKRAVIYEIHDRDSRKVYWISKGLWGKPLDIKADYLHLHDFFPCPKPLFGIVTSDSTVPVPEYKLYQDLADELNQISKRLSLLTTAIAVKAVYDSQYQDVLGNLMNADENSAEPVPNWPAWTQAGGLKGVMEFLPMKEIADVITILSARKQAILQEIYEVTGMQDIMMKSNPNESGEVAIKRGRFGSLRLRERQDAMQRFARDTCGMMAEIVAEHFSDTTIQDIADIAEMPPEEQQMVPDAIKLLRDDLTRNFRIEIETDSTIVADDDTVKQERMEFLQAAGMFLQQSLGTSVQYPAFQKAMTALLMFGVRGFAVGEDMEAQLEQAILQMEQEQIQKQQAEQEAAQQPPPPDPKMMELQMTQQIEQVKMQMAQEKLQFQEQMKYADQQWKQQLQAQQMQQDLDYKRQLLAMETQLKIEKINSANYNRQLQIEMKARQAQQDSAVKLMTAQGAGNGGQGAGGGGVHVHINDGTKVATFETDPVTGKRRAIVQQIPSGAEQ